LVQHNRITRRAGVLPRCAKACRCTRLRGSCCQRLRVDILRVPRRSYATACTSWEQESERTTLDRCRRRPRILQICLPSSRPAYSCGCRAIASARSWYCAHSVPHSAATLASSALARSHRPCRDIHACRLVGIDCQGPLIVGHALVEAAEFAFGVADHDEDHRIVLVLHGCERAERFLIASVKGRARPCW
jgi:hypothetical protein